MSSIWGTSPSLPDPPAEPTEPEEVRSASPGQALEDFWAQWEELRPQLEVDLEQGQHGPGSSWLTELTQAINPSLEWDLVPGRKARYALCLSAAAGLSLRPLTEKWVQSAPAPDQTWEFHSARIPISPEPVTVGESQFHPDDVAVLVETDPVVEALHLVVAHPGFARIDETIQLQAAFQMLDDLLGEDDAERWIASVETAPRTPGPPLPFLQLTERVAELAASATGQQWETDHQTDSELGDSELRINRALKRLNHLDLILLATVNFEPPGKGSAEAVQALEKELAHALGDRGVIFARETYFDFVAFYSYLHPDAVDTMQSFVESHHPAVYKVNIEPDLSWDFYEQMA